MVRVEEGDMKVAQALVEQWRSQLATISESSIVRKLLEKGLLEQENTLAKISQATLMRSQINALPEGQVKSQMGKALNVLERELGMEIETNQPSDPKPADSWELQILHGPEGKGRVVLKDIGCAWTIQQLKGKIEEVTSIAQASQRLLSLPAKTPIPGDETTKLGEAGIKNRDSIAVIMTSGSNGPSAPADPVTEKVLSMIDKAKVQVTNSQEAIVLAVHALLLREGFSCIAVEEQNGKGPKGFAPPVRVVPENKLVPPRWNADPGACTFQYRHSAKPGKEFQARCVWMDGTELVEMIQIEEPQTSALSLTFEAADYVNPNANYGELSTVYAGLEQLAGRIKDGLIRPLIPEQEKAKSTPNYGGIGSYIYNSTPPPLPGYGGGQPLPVPVPNAPMGPAPYFGGSGGPFSGVPPDFPGDLQPGGVFGPSGGNLMGPRHPAFDPERRGGPFQPTPGFGMPVPRFDPYGPVLPPTRGDPLREGNPNDPRSPFQAFKEPDPDDFPPPGTRNMFL